MRDSLEVKVGLFFLFALALLIAGVWWVKGKRLVGDTRTLAVAMADAGGLPVGAPVTIAGLQRGRVERLMAQEAGGVVVELDVDPDVQLRTDYRIEVVESGFMGQRTVAIDPGRLGNVIRGETVLRGETRRGLMGLTTSVDTTVTRLNQLLVTLSSESFRNALSNTIEHVAAVSGTLRVMTNDNRTLLRESLDDLRVVTRRVRRLVEESDDEVRATIDGFARASGGLESSLDSLRLASEAMMRVVRRFESGDGTLAMLLRDGEFSEDLRVSRARLDSLLREMHGLVRDIQRSPERYTQGLKLRLF
jgi:ABC-type transporter Mla subunit MlaD